MTYRLKYLVMPHYIYEDKRLNANQIKIYCFLNTYKSDKFYYTNEQLSEMFDAHPTTISKAITKLEEYGYIKTNYDIKSGGGQMRYITNQRQLEGLGEIAKSDLAKSLSKTWQNRQGKDNKIKDNKIKERYTSLKSLTSVDFQEIAEQYQVSPHFVREKFDDLSNYCESRGKKYKNYKATLKNWVKKDAPKNKIKKFIPKEYPTVDPEGLSRIRKMRQEFGL